MLDLNDEAFTHIEKPTNSIKSKEFFEKKKLNWERRGKEKENVVWKRWFSYVKVRLFSYNWGSTGGVLLIYCHRPKTHSHRNKKQKLLAKWAKFTFIQNETNAGKYSQKKCKKQNRIEMYE